MVTVWHVRFAEIIRGMLATFTSDNLIANLSNSKVPCSAVAISHISLSVISVLRPWNFQTPCLSPGAASKKPLMVRNPLLARPWLCQSLSRPNQHFWRVGNSSDCLMAGREQIIHSWQNQIRPELWNKLCISDIGSKTGWNCTAYSWRYMVLLRIRSVPLQWKQIGLGSLELYSLNPACVNTMDWQLLQRCHAHLSCYGSTNDRGHLNRWQRNKTEEDEETNKIEYELKKKKNILK